MSKEVIGIREFFETILKNEDYTLVKRVVLFDNVLFYDVQNFFEGPIFNIVINRELNSKNLSIEVSWHKPYKSPLLHKIIQPERVNGLYNYDKILEKLIVAANDIYIDMVKYVIKIQSDCRLRDSGESSLGEWSRTWISQSERVGDERHKRREQSEK